MGARISAAASPAPLVRASPFAVGSTALCFLPLLLTSRLACVMQESEACASLVTNSQLVLVDGANHNFTQAAAGQQMAQHVVNFALS